MTFRTLSRAVPAALLAWFVACTPHGEDYASSSQHATATADALPIDLDGIDLSDEACDCAAAYLKNLKSKLREAEILLESAKTSAAEAQAYLDEQNGKIEAERRALNEDIASDTALYTGIAVDSLALALDVSVPSSALVRRAACVAGKKMANQMIKRAMTTIAKRTTFDNPIKSGVRRVAIARVVEANANGPVEVLTWIPVIGPATEIYQKWNALKKRDELVAMRRENLGVLVADYDAKVAVRNGLLADVESFTAEVANLKSKITSFNTSQAMCEAFAGDPEVLGQFGIDPAWPKGWSEVFFVKTEPQPVQCQSAWIQITGSSRLSRFWGSRDAINAAKAHAEQMCFNNPIGSVPNPTCGPGYAQQRTAYFDYPGASNPGGDRHGAGCGAPRFSGSSTVWSDPLTEIDCWCYRDTCCGQVPTTEQAVAN